MSASTHRMLMCKKHPPPPILLKPAIKSHSLVEQEECEDLCQDFIAEYLHIREIRCPGYRCPTEQEEELNLLFGGQGLKPDRKIC